MTSRARLTCLGGVAALIGAWTGGQLWLMHRFAAHFNAQQVASAAFFKARQGEHPNVVLPSPSVYSTGEWVHAALMGTAAVLVLTAIAAVLVAGGRGWWALLITAVPLSDAVGRFRSGPQLGLGWASLSLPNGEIVGALIDAALLAAVVALLVRAIPSRPPGMPSRIALMRAIPIAVIVAGWFFARDLYTDIDHRVFLVQAMAFIVAAALVAGTSLPTTARIAVLALLPFGAGSLVDDLVGRNFAHLDRATFVHHVAIAAATAFYVAAFPVLMSQLRTRPSRRAATAS